LNWIPKSHQYPCIRKAKHKGGASGNVAIYKIINDFKSFCKNGNDTQNMNRAKCETSTVQYLVSDFESIKNHLFEMLNGQDTTELFNDEIGEIYDLLNIEDVLTKENALFKVIINKGKDVVENEDRISINNQIIEKTLSIDRQLVVDVVGLLNRMFYYHIKNKEKEKSKTFMLVDKALMDASLTISTLLTDDEKRKALLMKKAGEALFNSNQDVYNAAKEALATKLEGILKESDNKEQIESLMTHFNTYILPTYAQYVARCKKLGITL